MSDDAITVQPRTCAVFRALRRMPDSASVMDLLFIEAWEVHPTPHLASVLRALQIRRAHPLLCAEIRLELSLGRRLAVAERRALQSSHGVGAARGRVRTTSTVSSPHAGLRQRPGGA